jgi:hypothetical protein
VIAAPATKHAIPKPAAFNIPFTVVTPYIGGFPPQYVKTRRGITIDYFENRKVFWGKSLS